MKVKTSVTLSPSTIKAIDRAAGRKSNRSRFIEQAVLEFLRRRTRIEREARDLKILNEHADALNREAEDVLAYQVRI